MCPRAWKNGCGASIRILMTSPRAPRPARRHFGGPATVRLSPGNGRDNPIQGPLRDRARGRVLDRLGGIQVRQPECFGPTQTRTVRQPGRTALGVWVQREASPVVDRRCPRPSGPGWGRRDSRPRATSGAPAPMWPQAHQPRSYRTRSLPGSYPPAVPGTGTGGPRRSGPRCRGAHSAGRCCLGEPAPDHQVKPHRHA